MGSDLFALSALAKELDAALKGAKVDKIQQPESDELRFSLRKDGKTLCLVLSCNAQAPRVHLTSSKKPSPKTAPNVCMLLRKYLSVAMIGEVGVFNADRILFVRFDAKTEMRDDATFYLFAEIMNRYSNLVFTDENLVILDAIKHLPLDVARDHVVMRGVKYAPVAQKKRSYMYDCSDIPDAYTGNGLRKFILDNISGFSGATADELILRAGVREEGKLCEEELVRLKNTLAAFREGLPLSPCVIAGEVYPFPYRSLGEKTPELFATMSEAYDALYTSVDKEIRNKARLKSLVTSAKRLRARVEKNIAQDLERLAECGDMEKFRVYGELIVNNIYKISKGDESLTCVDFYTGEEVRVPLDPTLSPSKNSAAYFAKYNKLKRTREFVTKKLEGDRELLQYVLSIEDELSSLPYDAGVTQIEEELALLLGNGRKKGKVRKEQAEPPYVYEVDGFTILRGKNNVQNDELTFRIASSSDVWLHLKNDFGPHVVISSEGKRVPDKVLTIAAEIAACFKQAPCDVDYTQRKNVKRKPGGHPGQVIYVDFKTLRVLPDAHTEYLLKH